MTFCLGIRTVDGLVAVADTRITSGNECLTAKKIIVQQDKQHSMFIMTSGLRSVRDKAITYFKEVIKERDEKFTKLYKAVNSLAEQLRQVAREDKQSLTEAGLHFNLSAIIGGQLEEDEEHKLYMLYPEGNWVEVGIGSPFFIIGNSGYGKPLLDRFLTYHSPLKEALQAGFLSFDATRTSSNDVEFPIDIAIYEKDSFKIKEFRFIKDDLAEVSKIWSETLRHSIQNLPGDWLNKVFKK